MSDTVYLYPKTSCPCDNCDQKFEQTNGVPTNLSVPGCRVSPVYNCINRVQIDESVQPQAKQGWSQLNPQVYNNKLAAGFNPVKCHTDTNTCGQKGTCPYPSYISPDPRLWSATRAGYTPLDRIPIDGDVKLKDIYNKKWEGYGTGFQPYKKIRDGQIIYYYDKSIEDPYFTPVYGQKANIHKVIYKDPMGGVKPEYNREWISNVENPATTTTKQYPYCLSYIQDTQSHREDLLGHQMRKRNQERWMPRWDLK